jgi:MSHA biogenesis protein MshL
MFIMINRIILFALVMFMFGCAEIEPEPFEPSTGHINTEESSAPIDSTIPELVEQVPLLPEPSPSEPPERYTVVVNEVPVKELLFALARDAKVNVDIHSGIDGVVTINAVEQTLPQILKRISNQVNMRYEQDGNNLIISQDTPFLRTYKVDYVNLSRDTISSSAVSTQISSTSGGAAGSSSGSGGGNNSTTDVTTESTHHFWSRLVSNISAIIGESTITTGGEVVGTEAVIPNPESGILTVMATASQHKQIQSFVDQVLVSAKRQVLVQTTIVEVTLDKDYQAGIDWSYLNAGGIQLLSSTLLGAPVVGAVSSFVIQTNDDETTPPGRNENLTATVSLLDEFGDTKILSSPQIMVLNNQTALLKVVENIVYFEVDAETTSTQGVQTTSIDTTALSVSVGIVMSVTPQIDSDGTITLNVRPTISRVNGFVTDPNPNANFVDNAGNQIVNQVPQIAVREMESVLRMTDGQIGVLGGLMTDRRADSDAGLPGLKDTGFLGNAFKTTAAEYTKTELVIFIKPIIINNPSTDSDMEEYKKYLSNDYHPSSRVLNQGDNAL